jgi:hypothetical protein
MAKQKDGVKHSEGCTLAHDAYDELCKEYSKGWPNYCRRCDGWGINWGSYDSDTGVWDANPCSECLDEGKCPQCGSKLKEVEELDIEGGCTEWDWRCYSCGWSEKKVVDGDIKGLPEPPECMCWMESYSDER